MSRTTLTVEEFGPISKAEIEIRPLTVFVGPSNTGKSYLAILIYAIHRFLSREIFEYNPPTLSSSRFDEQRDNVLREVAKWWRLRVRKERLHPDGSQKSHIIPESLATYIRPLLTGINEADFALADEICRCFGVDTIARLVRHGSNKFAQVSCEIHSQNHSLSSDPIGFQFKFGKDDCELTSSIPPTIKLPTTLQVRDLLWPWRIRRVVSDDIERNLEEQFEEELELFFIPVLLDNILTLLFNDLCKNSYYLPADRAGIMHAHNIFVKSIIGRSSRSKNHRSLARTGLSGVLVDFLETLIDLADHSKKRLPTEQSHIAKELERNLLQGTVTADNSIVKYPAFQYTPTAWKKGRSLPLANASSMVSEIAPVILYLQYIVEPGEVLIIEEPESHLHPEMQVEFFRYLVRTVRSGIRIVVITHSDWIIEELANTICSSSLDEDKRDGIEGADAALRSDEVGIWYFLSTGRESGSVVRQISLDLESGAIPSGFEDVSQSLYNKWVELVNRIEESN